MAQVWLIGAETAAGAALAAHLRAAGHAVTEAETPTPAEVLLCARPLPAEASLSLVQGFAKSVPPAAQEGADRRAQAQVLFVFETAQTALQAALAADATEALVRRAALAFAPDLRVNAIALGPTRPRHPERFAAWPAHQPPPPAQPFAEALGALADYLLQAPALTGQTLILDV